MQKIALVGANGQLGRAIALCAARSGLPLHCLTRAQLDITDRTAVLDLVGALTPAAIINAAAYTAVDRAESDEAAALAVNRDGPAHLADACATAGIPLIHFSTDYVFDGRKPTAYTEDDRPAPINVYGAGKFAGEEAVRRRCARHVILRTSWLYGAHGGNFVKTVLRLARERDSLRIVDDQRGCPTLAGDLAEAALAIAARLQAASAAELFGTFHCAGSGATTWFRFARRTVELASPAIGRKPAVEAIATADYPAPARRPANSALDCRRLADIYGLSLRSWEAALPEMLGAALAVESRAENA